MTHPIQMLKASAVVVLGTLLVACGGGGGGSPAADAALVASPVVSVPVVVPPPSPVLTVSSIQGFWDAAPAGTSRMNAVILPNGQMWVVHESAGVVTGLANSLLSFDGTMFSSTGQYFSLPNGAQQNYQFSGSLPSGSRASLLTTIGIGANAASSSTWTYNSSYEKAVNQRDVQARWSGSLGAINVLWDVDATGKLAGTSTTGCTYIGLLAVNATALAVLDVAITESCAGKQQSLNGIARFSTDKTSLSMVYTTAVGVGGVSGGVIVLRK